MGPCSGGLDANAASLSARGCCAKGLLSGEFKAIAGMWQNVIACDREQSFSLPPDVGPLLSRGRRSCR
jgi:hypothetical protein